MKCKKCGKKMQGRVNVGGGGGYIDTTFSCRNEKCSEFGKEHDYDEYYNDE
jgi:hypothetical protein